MGAFVKKQKPPHPGASNLETVQLLWQAWGGTAHAATSFQMSEHCHVTPLACGHFLSELTWVLNCFQLQRCRGHLHSSWEPSRLSDLAAEASVLYALCPCLSDRPGVLAAFWYPQVSQPFVSSVVKEDGHVKAR